MPRLTSGLAVGVEVGLVGAAYVVAVWGAWARLGPGRVVSTWRAGCFVGGLLVAAGAVVGPMDGLADRSLPAHMTQHVLLMLVAGPLLAVGRPVEVLARLLPDRLRRSAMRGGARASRSARGDGWPRWAAATVTLHTVVMLGWHVPALYQLAVRNEGVHGLEHLSMTVAAVVMWWVLLDAGRPRPAAGAVLALFAADLPMTLLGVALMVSRTVWYPVYGTGLQGQQVAGAVLWGFGGALMVIEAVAVFAWWLSTSDDRVRPVPAG
ncbi:MAG TPA: cytochrome c oxidase assembly protein [Acidimicrobiales bacterium]